MHEPWRLSAYQVQSALLGVPPAARVAARLPDPERITPELAEAVRDELREFTRLGGFTLHPGSTPWFGATLRTRAEAHEAVELAGTLSARTLPRLAARLAAACRETGLPPACASYPERTRLTHLFTLLHEADQPGRGFRERRALRKEARAEWTALAGGAGPGGEPRLPSDYPALALAWREAEQQLAALAAFAPQAGLGEDPEKASAALAADAETPWRLPRLHELARRFGALGLAQLLDEIGSRTGRWHDPRRRSWPRSTTRGTARSWTRSGSATPTTTPSTASPSTRSPKSSALATPSTWPRTAPGCAARGPGSCGTRSTSTRCRPG